MSARPTQPQDTSLDEEECDEEYLGLLIAAIAVTVVLAEEAHTQRVAARNPSRLYLTRSQLLPNPRHDTPWTRLFKSRSPRAFITTMGFDPETFDLILSSGFAEAWYNTPIPRTDTHVEGNTRPGRRSLDAAGALGLTLHYLNSTMREISLQQIFALVPSTVSRYITFSLILLLRVLKALPDARISWPSEEEFSFLSSLIQERHPRLHGAFGSIDGLNLLLQESPDQDIENSTYNGWTSTHNVSSVLVYSPRGDIIACNLNAPGSWHDAHVARPIYKRLEERTPDGYYLVADTAFPKGTQDIAGRIVSPLKANNRIAGTEEEITETLHFNRELLSYRQTAEWGNRALQGSFGRLRIPLEVGNADRRGDLLEICARLHNLRARRVGINQIKQVYEPCWKQTDSDFRVWDDFRDIMFGEQRKYDRVSRYHIHVDYDVEN
ncbi:hypothetical protein NMY22_g14947 [Coprinellus aureogranulatus]|nr:hypothetical protein NMY22_g14947 [Coprinellus aureogranulatus]